MTTHEQRVGMSATGFGCASLGFDDSDGPLARAARDLTGTDLTLRDAGALDLEDPGAALQRELDAGASILCITAAHLVDTGAARDDAAVEAFARSVEGPIAAAIEAGRHVLLVGASTLTGDESTLPPGRLPAWTLQVHRVDAGFIRLSAATGASVVDGDRLVAERGSAGLVAGPGRLTSEGLDILAREIVRVLADRGALTAHGEGSDRAVRLPDHLPHAVHRVKLAEWLVAPGDRVAFGQDLCRLVAVEMSYIERGTTARRMLKGGEYKSGTARIDNTARKIPLVVTAGDAATILEHACAVGDELGAGDLLARISPDGPSGAFKVSVTHPDEKAEV